MVAADNSVVTVTALAASSGSPPICAAMLKEDTAVGVANMEINAANSGPRRPDNAASDRAAPGYTNSRRAVQIARFRRWSRTSWNSNCAPSRSRATGEADAPSCEMGFSRQSGRRSPERFASRPATEATIRGFFAMPSRIWRILICFRLKVSRVTTARAL